MSGGRSKPARSNEHSADGGLLQSPYRQVSSAGHGTPARASQAPIEDSGESEESEIDLSPISADRRASLAARYSASPSKFNGLGTSLDGPTSPVLGRNGNSAQLRAGGLVTEDEDVVGGTDGEDEEGPGAALNADSENTDDEDEDGPPVEESTSLAKSKALEARQKAADARKEQSLKRKRSAEAKASRKAASQKESTADSEAAQEADEEDASEEEAMDDTARAEEPPASKKGRLDPALFAEAFSKKSSAAPPSTKMLTRQGSSERQRQTRSSTAAKSKSLVKGRDGQPMKRLPDGRTVVRAIRTTLTPSTSSKAADEDSEPIEQPDVNLSRPNAKARAFTKKALGLRPSDVADSKKDNKKDKKDKDKPKKPVRTEDDPLGLEDPLFMNLDGKGKKGKTTKVRDSTLTGRRPRGQERGSSSPSTSRQGYRGEGGRKSAGSTSFLGRRSGPAALFRRS